MREEENTFLQKSLVAFLCDDIQHNEVLPTLTPLQWEALMELARKQHVQEYLYYNLKHNHLLDRIPDEWEKKLTESFKRRTFQNLGKIGEFHRISNALHEQHIPVIALKGLHLVESVYPHIATRYFRDLDILIPNDRAKEAYMCVESLGYFSEKKLTDLDFSFLYHHHINQLFHRNNKTVLEIHGYISDDFKDEASLLWENTIPSKDQRQYHLTFDIEDLLINLCIHISYNDLFKIDLRHYLDIYLLVQKHEGEIDWNKVMKRSQDRQCLTGVAIVLSIVEQLFPIDLPKMATVDLQHHKTSQQTVEYALDFLWMYDKSSKGYLQYKAKIPLPNDERSFVKKAINRIFLDKQELAFHYSLDKNSSKLYVYYFVRFIDLIKRHFKTIFENKLFQGNKTFIEKTHYVSDYLLKT